MIETTLDPDLLRAYLAVVECRSFSRAGERLRRNQSTVSLQIQRLEEQVGALLLTRSPKRVDVTPEGELILDYARRILALNDELIARVREPALSGVVRLGAPEDFATTHLPSVLARFSQAHPQVALEVTCDLTLRLLDAFAAGELDLALIKRDPSGLGGPEAAGAVRVWREPLVWAASDRLVPQRGAQVPLVVSPRPCVYRQRATDALQAAGRPWRIAYTCGSLSGAQAAVRAGLGLTVLPKEMVPADFVILDEANSALPDLRDTEIALMEAPQTPRPAQVLKDFVIRALEHRE